MAKEGEDVGGGHRFFPIISLLCLFSILIFVLQHHFLFLLLLLLLLLLFLFLFQRHGGSSAPAAGAHRLSSSAVPVFSPQPGASDIPGRVCGFLTFVGLALSSSPPPPPSSSSFFFLRLFAVGHATINGPVVRGRHPGGAAPREGELGAATCA